MDKNRYAWIQPISGTFEEAVAKVRQALMQQGFGILTEIDVSTTFQNKLQVSWPKTLILGACNPPLAHKAMMADHDVSVFLPCNVVVRETRQGSLEIAVINPEILGDIIQNHQLSEVAAEVSKRIRLALDQLAA
ncbi:MAG: DUF302 domain-containing protein [Magnetococcales bacterium]|nr:DUF302 domain-containing protein [Magnetococcales bacterium]MBF0150313.1 DUF302 domain-containing protein [Magnetococcales bacterium]MBF0173192.1 DUF302 domain-containing protein [Magnetococcales bacterium]MBF0347081.1 DUF302 domain-containing protein [Magnetococcales bacterium]MBF0629562.1 DUF302 domain-containing protein [Magnetococcales bacterium]